MAINYTKYIAIDPGIRFGKPYLKDTRITVADVLGWMASGMSSEEILADFPELTLEEFLPGLCSRSTPEIGLDYTFLGPPCGRQACLPQGMA